MQKKGWMDSHFSFQWTDKFIEILEGRKLLNLTTKHMILLNGHKSHVTLQVIIKAKQYSIDLISLLSYTSHEL